MSGHPLLDSRSAGTYRDQYMHNLVLKSKLTDANFNANNFSNGLTITKDQRAQFARTAAQTRASVPGAIPVQSYEDHMSRRALLVKQLSEITEDPEHVVLSLGDLSDFVMQHLQEILQYIYEYHPEFKEGLIPEVLIITAAKQMHRNRQKTAAVAKNLQQTGNPIKGLKQYLLKSGRLFSQNTLKKLARLIESHGRLQATEIAADHESDSDWDSAEEDNYLQNRKNTLLKQPVFTAVDEGFDVPAGPDTHLSNVFQNVAEQTRAASAPPNFFDINAQHAQGGGLAPKPGSHTYIGRPHLNPDRYAVVARRQPKTVSNTSIPVVTNFYRQEPYVIKMGYDELKHQMERLMHFETQFVFLLNYLSQKEDCYPELEALDDAMVGIPTNNDLNDAINRVIKYHDDPHALMSLHETMDVTPQLNFLESNRAFLMQRKIALQHREQEAMEMPQLMRLQNYPRPSPVLNAPVVSSANSSLVNHMTPNYGNMPPPMPLAPDDSFRGRHVHHMHDMRHDPTHPHHMSHSSHRHVQEQERTPDDIDEAGHTDTKASLQNMQNSHRSLSQPPHHHEIMQEMPSRRATQAHDSHFDVNLPETQSTQPDFSSSSAEHSSTRENIKRGRHQHSMTMDNVSALPPRASRPASKPSVQPLATLSGSKSSKRQRASVPTSFSSVSTPRKKQRHAQDQQTDLDLPSASSDWPTRTAQGSRGDKGRFAKIRDKRPSSGLGEDMTRHMGRALEMAARPVGVMGGHKGAMLEPLMRTAGQHMQGTLITKTGKAPPPRHVFEKLKSGVDVSDAHKAAIMHHYPDIVKKHTKGGAINWQGVGNSLYNGAKTAASHAVKGTATVVGRAAQYGAPLLGSLHPAAAIAAPFVSKAGKYVADNYGYKGWGLPNPKILKSRMKGHGVSHIGIQQSEKYVPFGKFYIQHHALIGKGMLMLRQPGGGYVTSHKPQKVSEGLVCAIDDLLHNQIPDFDKLSEDEKKYLRKLAATAELDDRLRIPAPKKSAEQSQEDKFEVLVGEIRAGNDSPELLQRVKNMVEIMEKEGKISSEDAKDVCNELAQIGIK
jgi:hypothetical protein